MTGGERNIIRNIRSEFTATKDEKALLSTFTDRELLDAFTWWNGSDKSITLWAFLKDYDLGEGR